MYNMLNKFWLFVKACDICQRTKKEKHEKFVAHLIVMGILKKNSLEQYWSRDSILNMPFFGCYMSRNRFQNILWNLHISDPDETNPLKGEADHDPLFLVRPMVDMMQRNFHTKYRPRKGTIFGWKHVSF